MNWHFDKPNKESEEEARQFISSHIDEFELANEAYALEHEDAGDRT